MEIVCSMMHLYLSSSFVVIFALLRGPQRNATAYALRRAGDDHYLVLKTAGLHACFSG
jgi:hypothetical protein